LRFTSIGGSFKSANSSGLGARTNTQAVSNESKASAGQYECFIFDFLNAITPSLIEEDRNAA
jgi:hypothetical protein